MYDAAAGGSGWLQKFDGGSSVATLGGGMFRVFTQTGSSNTVMTVLERLRIDDNGNVGIGTSLPTSNLHIQASTPVVNIESTAGNAGSSSTLAFGHNQEGNATAVAKMYTYLTNGSAANRSGHLRIQTAYLGLLYDRMTISDNGNIGIGTTNPVKKLLIETATQYDGVFLRSGTKWVAGLNGFGLTNDNGALQLFESNIERIRLVAAGTSWISGGYLGIGFASPSHLIHLSGGAYSDGATWVNGSSRELKENILGLSTQEAMDTLKYLNPVKFNYKNSPSHNHIGFIAEDVPDLIATGSKRS